MPFVQAGAVRLHYREQGSGPEPLVFVHGFLGSAHAWDAVCQRLAPRYHAYAFDLRGAGQSDKPDGDYSLAVFAEDLELATRALGVDTFSLVGWSLGGGVAMQYAVRHAARLRHLVLVASLPSDGFAGDWDAVL